MRRVVPLLIVLCLGFAPAPVYKEKPDTRTDLETAGLTPFTPETGNLSLADFKRLLHPLKADLVITKVEISPLRPKVGEVIGATLYYKNIGGKPAANFHLRGEPGTLSKGGFGLGGDFARLAPGEEKQYSWGAIQASKAGLHTLTFSIDPDKNVDESNRRNNSHSIQVRVIAK